MHTQNLSEPVFFITSASTTFIIAFKWIMVRHNGNSIKFLQIIDLLHGLRVTLTDIRPDNLLKKIEKKCG